ncbi:MAG: MaoC family dehydratase [Ktedonobacteraceae bacterium]
MQDAKAAFKQRLREEFATVEVGQTFTFRRTFTDGDVALFCGVTGDYNPYHIDDTFAQESWFGRRIIPGLLTGSMLTHIGGMLGILATEMHFEYLKPVYIGDTVTCVVTIIEKDVEKRVMVAHARFTNQEDVEVLSAQFNGFPAHVRLAK